MSRWYRAYADAERNPKVAALSDKDFRLWHRLLSVAAENDGHIPPIEALKRVLSMRLDHLLAGVKRLVSAGLIDPLGDGYAPHNWSKRQYKSDSSAERVRKHRQKRAVTVTPPETDTDTETEKPSVSIVSDKSDTRSPAASAGDPPSDLFGDDAPPDCKVGETYSAAFEAFWAKYPSKVGKRKAASAYDAAFKRLGGSKAGAARVHGKLLAAVGAQREVWKAKGTDARFIPHASTWLNQSRWDDEAVQRRLGQASRPKADPVGLQHVSPAAKPARRPCKHCGADYPRSLHSEDCPAAPRQATDWEPGANV